MLQYMMYSGIVSLLPATYQIHLLCKISANCWRPVFTIVGKSYQHSLYCTCTESWIPFLLYCRISYINRSTSTSPGKKYHAILHNWNQIIIGLEERPVSLPSEYWRLIHAAKTLNKFLTLTCLIIGIAYHNNNNSLSPPKIL